MRRHRFGCGGTTYQTNYQAMPGVTQTVNNNTCAQGTMPQNTTYPQYGTNGVTTYQELTPIMTCSKNVVNQYHVVKQPYVHTYHTEVVHHHIKQAEYIPNYTCSEVHVNETPTCGR